MTFGYGYIIFLISRYKIILPLYLLVKIVNIITSDMGTLHCRRIWGELIDTYKILIGKYDNKVASLCVGFIL